MNLSTLRGLACVSLVAASLAACAGGAGPGGLNGMTPEGDPMPRITYACSDGNCSPDEIVVVAIAAQIANEQLVPQFTGKVESAATGCTVYGLGYAAAGASQNIFYAGASAAPAAGVGAVTGCMGGLGNGLYTFSYAVDASTGFHTEEILRDWEHGTKIPDPVKRLYPNISDLCSGLHVSASYIRTHNLTPDSVKGKVWHGAPVGSPTTN